MHNDLVPASLAAKMAQWRREAKPWVPHEYQGTALKALLENAQFGLLLEPGLGKSAISLAAVKVLLKRKLIKRVLVVAPLRVCEDTWPSEVCNWSDFKDLRIALLHGDGKDKVLRQLRPEHTVCVINPDGLPWLMASAARVKMLGADTLIIDESSLFKNSQSLRFRRLRTYLPKFKRRYILTGSPRPKSYLDLFAQIYLLDRGASLGQYITHYKNRWFFQTGFQMREWEILPGAAEEINALVAPLVLRLDARDYLKLPKEIEQIHRVELPSAVRVEYDSIEDTLMSTLFSAPFVNSAAARSKCAQLANGAIYLDAGPQDERWPTKTRPVKFIHTAKVDALVELHDELQGAPLLVSIGFKHDVDAIRKALGAGIPAINGDTTKAQAADYIERWNKGLLPVLMIAPQSAGHGINLQKSDCHHVAFFDLPDNYDTYFQTFCRVFRQGNKASFVIRHLFVTQKTVDVAKLANLRRKGNGQQDFLKAMKEYADQRYAKLNKKRIK
jgi:SNF2 family DNA or RNA helicase